MKFYKNSSGEMMAAIPGIELVEKWNTQTGLDVIVCKLSDNCVKALRDQLNELLPDMATDLELMRTRQMYSNAVQLNRQLEKELADLKQSAIQQRNFDAQKAELHAIQGKHYPTETSTQARTMWNATRLDTEGAPVIPSPIIPYEPPASILKEEPAIVRIDSFDMHMTQSKLCRKDPVTALSIVNGFELARKLMGSPDLLASEPASISKPSPQSHISEYIKRPDPVITYYRCDPETALRGNLEKDTLEAGVKPADSALSRAWKGWKA